jgi:hypothetical protein
MWNTRNFYINMVMFIVVEVLNGFELLIHRRQNVRLFYPNIDEFETQ